MIIIYRTNMAAHATIVMIWYISHTCTVKYLHKIFLDILLILILIANKILLLVHEIGYITQPHVLSDGSNK